MTNIETVWKKICLRRLRPLVTEAIYRPSGKGRDLAMRKEIMSDLSEIKSKLEANQEIHICGDFDCNLLKPTFLYSYQRPLNDLRN